MSFSENSRGRYSIGDSIGVWYNPVENSKYDPTLEQIFCEVHVFRDRKQVIDFIRRIETEQIFFIFSGDIDEDLIKIVHDFEQTTAIYILDKTKSLDEEKQLKKVRCNYTSMDELYQSIRQTKQQTENNTTKVTISTLNFDEIDPSFIYSQLLKDILLNLHYTDEDRNMFAEFAKSRYPSNSTVQKDIDRFQHNNTYSPIWWYTCESIFYSMLNGALRQQDIDVLHKLGFFIRDLHEQLCQLQTNVPLMSPMTVYRGQGLNPNVFKQMQSTPNGIISFHHFLSTSRHENLARFRAESSAESDELVGILFEMTIDSNINDIPFASIDDQSAFGFAEAEVLFSINTIFRIGQIESLDRNLYRVHLTLVHNNDQEIQKLTQYLQEEIHRHDDPLFCFGQLTLRMQEWTKAKEIYDILLNKCLDNHWEVTTSHCYHQLGYIHYQFDQFDTALDYLRKSLDTLGIRQRFNKSAAADTYSMIGQVMFQQKKDLQAALQNMQHALTIRRTEYDTEPQTLAKNYTQIGETLLYLQRHDEALIQLNEALKIQLRSLPKYHMDLASTYSTISHVYHDKENYHEGFSYCEKALGIYQHSLRQNHPSLATAHTNMSNNLAHLKHFDEAIVHAEKALEITQLYRPPDHDDIAKQQGILHEIQTAQKRYQN